MTGLIILLGIGLVILWGIGVVFTYYSLTRPPRRTYASAIRRGLPGDPSELDHPREYTDWTYNSNTRKLSAWDITGEDPSGPVAIFTHGWASAKTGALLRLEPIIESCSRLIAYDQPGHGESPGSCDLGVGEVDDLVALLEHIDNDTPVILYGWSMGAGVAIAAAAKHSKNIAAVIAEAPYRLAYTPAKNVVSQSAMPWRATLWPGFWLMGLFHRRPIGWAGEWPAFDRAELAKNLACPLLVIHGEDDATCPLIDGQEIAQAAPSGSFVSIKDATHNGLWIQDDSKAQITKAISEFLDLLTEAKAR